MAQFIIFDKFRQDVLLAKHNFNTHVYKLMLLPNAAAVAKTDADPKYATYAGSELTGGQVPAGGLTLDNFTVNNTGIDLDDEILPVDGGNPATVRKVVLYNDSDPDKVAVGFADYGADQDLTQGGSVTPSGAGIITTSSTP